MNARYFNWRNKGLVDQHDGARHESSVVRSIQWAEAVLGISPLHGAGSGCCPLDLRHPGYTGQGTQKWQDPTCCAAAAA